MRWPAALTPSRPPAMGAALACAFAMIATGVAAAEPIAVADQRPAASPAVPAKPVAKPTPRKKRVLRKKPVVLIQPAAMAQPAAVDSLDPGTELLVQHRWPAVPFGHQLSMSDQITDRLTEIGNTLGEHLDLLSQDMFQLKVDGRRRRAHIGLGGGGGDDLLTFKLNGDIQFDSLNARVEAHLDLGINGHTVRLDLPSFQVQADEYRGDYGVQVEVPVFEHRF